VFVSSDWRRVTYQPPKKEPTSPKGKQALVAKVLSEFEEAGDAMRYLRADGKFGWKPTPRMLAANRRALRTFASALVSRE
jgi:hypothetical protein